MPHARRGRLDIVCQARRAHERQRPLAYGPSEVAVPVLALLADVEGVEKVRTRASGGLVADGAKVRDRNVFDRRLLEAEIADRGVGRPSKALDLLERWKHCATFPGLNFGKAEG